MKLVLFDIDGTIIASGGAGEKSLRAAVRERFGADDGLGDIEIAGRTDTGIIRQVFAKYGLPHSLEDERAFLDLYLQHLARLLPQTPGRVLPGVVVLLEALKQRDDILLGLLTGNVERGAKLKLINYGLEGYFQFGAYADDSHDRNQLGAFARTRAREAHGGEIAPERVFVLGDTPHDIACGRAIGARTVGVATGGSTLEQLRAHHPDFLFADFADTPAVLAIFND